MAWVVILLPLALSWGPFRPIPESYRQQVGNVLIMLGLLFLTVVVTYQRVIWWPQVAQWQQNVFWQRCGFIIATTVDVPMLQMILAGVLLVWRERFSDVPPIGNEFSPEAGVVRQR